MATLDRVATEKKGKATKKKSGMANAVSSTEKIRTWVSVNEYSSCSRLSM
jgi:hypothetical protein